MQRLGYTKRYTPLPSSFYRLLQSDKKQDVQQFIDESWQKIYCIIGLLAGRSLPASMIESITLSVFSVCIKQKREFACTTEPGALLYKIIYAEVEYFRQPLAVSV